MESSAQAMSVALDRIWAQFLPAIEERVAKLKEAGDALAMRSLPEDLRTEAHAAAHKLAGVLGTFGLAQGTLLAREGEAILCGDSQPGPAAVARFNVVVQQLRDLVAGRNRRPSSDYTQER
jgi:HPt (histidine-containing phosphotransfer) domain-containing protein